MNVPIIIKCFLLPLSAIYPQKIDDKAENIIVTADTTPIADTFMFRSSDIFEKRGGIDWEKTISKEVFEKFVNED